jgi:hypothetical protein
VTEWTEQEGRIVNQDGDVACGYYQPIVKQVTLRSGKVYVFQNNYVSMAWVKPEDVDEVLSIPFGCCQSKKAGAFFLANANYVRRHLNQELVGR